MSAPNRHHTALCTTAEAAGTGLLGSAKKSSNSFFSVAKHFAAQRAAIDAGEVFFHCACEQWNVWDLAEIFGDEPDRCFRRHPVQMIEARQVHRARVASQGAFAAQVK